MQPWGKNYFAATFANTFLSRKAFLVACGGRSGNGRFDQRQYRGTGQVPGVLVRYEAAYRFETQFKVKVEQAGQIKMERLYGARANLKIWAFANKLKTEVAWPWGAVENVVWEGHEAYVDLQKGAAKITLTAAPSPRRRQSGMSISLC